MAIDWDALVLAPVMGIFGEGDSADPLTWPLYTPRGGTPFRLADAVFDRAYSEVQIQGDGSAVTSRKPCLGVRDALFETPPRQNDQVFIPSVNMTFIVSDVQPDGHGDTRLILMVARS